MIDWGDVFLGFVQGATEFLPVSSSGHLFLMDQILKGGNSSLSFVLFLHLATFFAVFAVFFKDIKFFVFGLQKKKNLQLLLKLLISLLPLLFVGLFLKNFVQQSFEKNTVAFGFFSTGLLLLTLFFVPQKNRPLEEMSFLQAFLIGLAQALAVLPGFSRSAWTISAGIYCGLSPRSAVYFSFLISLPAIFGSALMAFLPQVLNGSPAPLDFFSNPLSLFLSFLTAFLTSWLCLLLVLRMVQGRKFYLFSFYLLPLSAFVFWFL